LRVENLFFGDRQRQSLPVHLLEETALVTGVASPSGLLDLEKKHVFVAIDIPAFDFLSVAAGFSLEPELVARTAPIVHEAGFDGFLESFTVHPGEHEDATVRGIAPGGFLHDGGDETVGCEFEIEFHCCRMSASRIIRKLP